jgi:predicted nucleic-acid-binding Zn-ribbon protein
MAKRKEVKEYSILGQKLTCPICKHTEFWTRETLMNTTGMTLAGIEWANRKATNYICNNCGHIQWFMK